MRRALDLLTPGNEAASSLVWFTPDGTPVRLVPVAGAAPELEDDRTPEPVRAALEGLSEARDLLIDRLQLTPPRIVEVSLQDLGGPQGYLVAVEAGTSRTAIVLDPSPSDGAAGVRRAAAHQFAHAVALATGGGLSAGWSEALAIWTTLSLEGRPDDRSAALLSRRLARLDRGLVTDDPGLAAGNALWFAFLEQAYGLLSVSATVEELSRATPPLAALDRAVRRATHDDLAEAFREFQLWSIFVGARADRDHFTFADLLEAPGFASGAEGLPALAVLSDPPVAPWGASQVLIRPDRRDGGMSLHFEGEFGGRWQADLLLVARDGTLRRLPLEISAQGRGASAVPLEDLAEAVLLVRNAGGDDAVARRYTYAVHFERDYPFGLVSLEAGAAGAPGSGVRVFWETSSEQDLMGFNVLRTREDGGEAVVVNPVCVPALGDSGTSTAYHFLDLSAQPGVSYLYRIEGITSAGLTAESEPTLVRTPTRHRR